MNKIFYYTSTGNSLDIAKEIQKKIGGELISIPQALKNGNFKYEGDKVGFIYPCYSFNTPTVVREFIENLKLNSNYIFSIMTYGNLGMGGMKAFENQCKKRNIKLDYTNQLLMVDNYLPMFDIEEQLAKLEEKNIGKNLEKIIEDLGNKVKRLEKANIGQRLLSKVLPKISNPIHQQFGRKFKVSEGCTKCQVCIKVCPVDNISLVEEKIKFSKKCIACFGCLNHCPVEAISFSKMKGTKRYRNENITIKEIIDSNI